MADSSSSSGTSELTVDESGLENNSEGTGRDSRSTDALCYPWPQLYEMIDHFLYEGLRTGAERDNINLCRHLYREIVGETRL